MITGETTQYSSAGYTFIYVAVMKHYAIKRKIKYKHTKNSASIGVLNLS